MMVVADTSPLNYLILIGEIERLPALYRTVLIPREVHDELQRMEAPPAVRMWASALPERCEVRLPESAADAALNELDPGERDAILLALDAGVDLLLMDQTEGRREALRRSLRVTGTVAVLETAAHRGLIDFRSALERLEQLTFGSLRRFGANSSNGTHRAKPPSVSE